MIQTVIGYSMVAVCVLVYAGAIYACWRNASERKRFY